MRGMLASIIALYNYDNTIFDGLTLPTTDELDTVADLIDNIVPLDKNTLIDHILFEVGELSLIYTEPDTVKKMIEIWSKINHGVWLSLWETMLYKYNPIWNKDGTYTETSSGTESGTSGNTRTTTETTGGTHKHTGTISDSGSHSLTASNSVTTSHNVTGFDTSTYSPDTQDSTGGNGSESGTTGNTRTYNDTMTDSGSASGSITDNGTTSGTRSGSVTRVEQGNIGVTQSQELIESQRRIVQFNLYDFICRSFKEKFCVMIY